MVDITLILGAVIALASAVFATVAVPYIKSKFDAGKLETLAKWVKVAVEAAEQIFNETGLGEKKKAYVTKFLADMGYKVDLEYIENLIESEVYKLNNGEKKTVEVEQGE